MKGCPRCGQRYPDGVGTCLNDGEALQPLKDPRVGKTLAGRYRLENMLGEGGMAVVYRARNILDERPCAVKILNASIARDKNVRERFRREAVSAQRIAHPNVIAILDAGETDDGTCFMVMELLKGQPLDAVIAKGPIPIARALPIMIQVTRGIARAHDLDVIHRDLKPENIYLAMQTDGTDIVKLLDFGIARSKQDSRLTGANEVFGTPQYIAPERLMSSDAGGSQDLYALGVIFFEMLSSRLPFEANDIASFFMKHMRETPPRVSSMGVQVFGPLEELIDQLLKKDPHQRPVDAHRVLNDLLDISKQLNITPPPDPRDAVPVELTVTTTSMPRISFDKWVLRLEIYAKMVQRVYPQGAPNEVMQRLEWLRRCTQDIQTIRAESGDDQKHAQAVEGERRQRREQLGHAIDTLGGLVSKARDEARGAREGVSAYTQAVETALTTFKQAHAELLHWEGRAGHKVPYPELALAHRKLADLTDHWLQVFQLEKQAIAWAEAKEQEVVDLDYQVEELRTQLGKYEQQAEQQLSTLSASLAARGQKAATMEDQLLEYASQFCDPFRARPEVEDLFRALEQPA